MGGLIVYARPAWMDDAACKGRTRAFFPEHGEFAKMSEALRLCRACPVREECAAFGATEDYGIWGGLSVNQRRRPHRKKSAA